MAARKPTHAYVLYKDGDSAIVSVSLIKHYRPDNVTDLASNKLVCWRKNKKGYLSESYFRGDILTLGCGMDNLVSRKLRQGRIVPEQVFEESCQGTRLKKSTLQDTKQIRHHSKGLKKPGKGKILGKRRREDLDSGTDEEDELVPCRQFQEAKDEIAELEGRLRVSREWLHEERQRDIKLHILLDYKMDSMEASIIALIKLELHGTQPASQLFRNGVDTGHSVCFVEGTLDHDNASVVHSSLEQGCGMARITSSSTSGLQCMCPCGTCAPREGFPECKSRQKVDKELCLAFNTFIACGKLEKGLKADGKLSLCHIVSCLSSQGIKGHVIGLTNFRGGFYFAACTLMKELHLWPCRLSWGTENIKPIVEASRVLNYLLSCIALASTFCFLCLVSDIEKLATITGWVRDLSADGDIESNPGPVSFPTTYEEMSGPTFFDWARDKEGQGTDMLSGARAFVSNRACADVNTAIINNVLWHSGRLGEVKHLRLGTWTTLLYPTSVHGQQQLLSVADIRREDSRGKHVDSVPFEDLHSLVNPTTSLQGGAFRAKAEPCKSSCLFGVGSAQPNSQARSQPVAKDADAAGRQRQLSHPSPPSAPDVVVAAVGHTGNVLSSSMAMGKGVAFPLSGVGHYPFIRRQGTTAIVIGKGVPNSSALTGLVYAYRIPITVTHKGEEGSGVVRLGGDIVPEEDAVALRALRTDNSPTQMLANGSRVSLVGEWFPLKGNGTHTISHIRRWGPPCFVYRPEIAGPGGSTLTCTVMTEEERDQLKHTVITRDTDITKLRLLMSRPYPTTCEASAFKLGLMLAWANYGVRDAARFNVLTGQSQVHEPEVFIKEDSTITRLFNSSGVPHEDCGGLIQPAFPFFNGWKRGRLAFFAYEWCVPRGEGFLILPSCFEQGGGFDEAAVYLLSLLPWPWGNMSIVLETGVKGDPTPRKQMYTWYGATTIVPGALCINVVLNQCCIVDREYGEPPLAQYPTMGPTAVEFWPPFSPIPVNFEAGQDHFVPASAFAASWALGYDVGTISSVLAKIEVHGLFDNVGRWVLEAPLFAMSHAGIMATQKVQMLDTPAEEGHGKSLLPTIPTNMDDADDVPLLYRCWAAPGYRIGHIPKNAVWADVVLPPDGQITLPYIPTLSAVNSGLWRFDSPFASTAISVDDPLLAAIQFVASEQLFVGWHIFHSALGIATDSMQFLFSGQGIGGGEDKYFRGLFGYGCGETPDLGNLVQRAVTKIVNGPVLTTVTGVPLPFRLFPQRNWESQVLDFTNAVRITKACPTPMTDIVVFKYSTDVPREFLPFLVSDATLGNKDTFDAELQELPLFHGLPDYGCIGPFLYEGDEPDCRRVQEDDVVKVSARSLWQNRLMHSQSMYELRDYVTGHPVAGAPVAGEAPIEIPRGHDEWADCSFDFGTKMTPYPFFSTVWSGWMDSATRHVLALQQNAEQSAWHRLLASGVGSKASGVRFLF